jgi:glucokinase
MGCELYFMNTYAIAFDVGGTFIKAAVLNQDGQVLQNTLSVYPANSKEKKEEMLNYFVSLILQQMNRIMEKKFRISGIGYAFPGPFDYENGVCYIKGVNKFDHIYGVNIKAEINKRLNKLSSFTSKMTSDFCVLFENDANLFALGELLGGKAHDFERCICLTIGTGAGSAFIDKAEFITDRSDVPPKGWIYNEPFRESIVDDYISKQGILKIAEKLQLDPQLDVKEIAELAAAGDARSMEVFRQFGTALGESLLPHIQAFQPQGIIIGGQIAKSHRLFQERLLAVLSDIPVHVEFVDSLLHSTFTGVAKLLEIKKREVSI